MLNSLLIDILKVVLGGYLGMRWDKSVASRLTPRKGSVGIDR